MGPGAGCGGGIFRWYGSSKPIEDVLEGVIEGTEKGVNESAVTSNTLPLSKTASVQASETAML